jgi:hypothetical protein
MNCSLLSKPTSRMSPPFKEVVVVAAMNRFSFHGGDTEQLHRADALNRSSDR